MQMPQSGDLCQMVFWNLGGGEWGPQAVAKLVVKEAQSWCGPSEMEGDFSFGNESSQLRQLVNKLFQSTAGPVLGREWRGPSQWPSHLTLEALSLVGETGSTGSRLGWGKFRAEGCVPKGTLIPVWGLTGDQRASWKMVPPSTG